ncbi:MAG: hypothetical protein RJB66_872 [Pseudomonadota bacterium]|jgi:hypothetical protein
MKKELGILLLATTHLCLANAGFTFKEQETLRQQRIILARQVQCSRDSYEGMVQLFGQFGGITQTAGESPELVSFWFAYSGRDEFEIRKFESLCADLLKSCGKIVTITALGSNLLNLHNQE